MSTDPAIAAHKPWLGYIQPVGLVVTPPALAAAQCTLALDATARQAVLRAFAPDESRSTLVDALRLDLVGPSPDDTAHATEVLPTAPATWYLNGFLVPFEGAEPDPTESEQLDQIRPRSSADHRRPLRSSRVPV